MTFIFFLTHILPLGVVHASDVPPLQENAEELEAIEAEINACMGYNKDGEYKFYEYDALYRVDTLLRHGIDKIVFNFENAGLTSDNKYCFLYYGRKGLTIFNVFYSLDKITDRATIDDSFQKMRKKCEEIESDYEKTHEISPDLLVIPVVGNDLALEIGLATALNKEFYESFLLRREQVKQEFTEGQLTQMHDTVIGLLENLTTFPNDKLRKLTNILYPYRKQVTKLDSSVIISEIDSVDWINKLQREILIGLITARDFAVPADGSEECPLLKQRIEGVFLKNSATKPYAIMTKDMLAGLSAGTFEFLNDISPKENTPKERAKALRNEECVLPLIKACNYYCRRSEEDEEQKDRAKDTYVTRSYLRSLDKAIEHSFTYNYNYEQRAKVREALLECVFPQAIYDATSLLRIHTSEAIVSVLERGLDMFLKTEDLNNMFGLAKLPYKHKEQAVGLSNKSIREFVEFQLMFTKFRETLKDFVEFVMVEENLNSFNVAEYLGYAWHVRYLKQAYLEIFLSSDTSRLYDLLENVKARKIDAYRTAKSATSPGTPEEATVKREFEEINRILQRIARLELEVRDDRREAAENFFNMIERGPQDFKKGMALFSSMYSPSGLPFKDFEEAVCGNCKKLLDLWANSVSQERSLAMEEKIKALNSTWAELFANKYMQPNQISQ